MIVVPFTSTMMSSTPTIKRITNGSTPAGLTPSKSSTTAPEAMLQMTAGPSLTLEAR